MLFHTTDDLVSLPVLILEPRCVRVSNFTLVLFVFQMEREAPCLQVSVLPIKELCPWMPSPWVVREQEEVGWL